MVLTFNTQTDPDKIIYHKTVFCPIDKYLMTFSLFSFLGPEDLLYYL